jgi:hypothetical protein
MPKFRVTTQRTQEVVWLIDANSEEDAEEYYGEGEIIEENYGTFTLTRATVYEPLLRPTEEVKR